MRTSELNLQSLFLPRVGMWMSIAHLYDEFLNTLGDGNAVLTLKKARDVGTLEPETVGQLVRWIDHDISPDSCRAWLWPRAASENNLPIWNSPAELIRRTDWSEDDNARHLALHRAGGYLQLFRPKTVRLHRLHIERANAEFAWSLCKLWTERLDSKDKAVLVWNLFREHASPSDLLSDGQKQSRGRPPIALNEREKNALKETKHLHGVELAEILTELLRENGKRLFGDLTPKEFCANDGEKFNDRIRVLRRKAGMRARNYHRRM